MSRTSLLAIMLLVISLQCSVRGLYDMESLGKHFIDQRIKTMSGYWQGASQGELSLFMHQQQK